MSKFAVGDTVILVEPNHRVPSTITERVIAKRGRKYCYLEAPEWWIQATKFDIATGRQVTDSNYRRHIYTPEEWQIERHRPALLERFRKYQPTLDYPSRIPTPTLEKLLAVLDAAADQ